MSFKPYGHNMYILIFYGLIDILYNYNLSY